MRPQEERGLRAAVVRVSRRFAPCPGPLRWKTMVSTSAAGCRAPYLAVTGFTIGAYVFHPVMQAGSYWLGW